MTLSIDDLVRLYDEHSQCIKLDAKAHAMRVVVKALRDDLVAKTELFDGDDTWWISGWINDRINEILAERGDEAAGSTPESTFPLRGVEGEPPSSPAAAPTVGERLVKAAHEAAAIARGDMQPGRVYTPAAAPDDVCEWMQCSDSWLVTECSPIHRLNPLSYKAKGSCCFCSRPIKFVEAAR